MLIHFQEHLTPENVYLWINLCIIPLWLMLIIIPHSNFTQIFVNSILLPLILSTTYVYLLYQAIIIDEPIMDIFKLFLSIDNLYTVFASESFLIIFWIHFVALNLFMGSWVSRDAVKYNISRGMAFIPLILIYFSGPLGLVLYWFIRIFYSKKISLYD